MRKRINGVIYDTAVAQGIAIASALPYTAGRYWEEMLYRTVDGRYFVAGRSRVSGGFSLRALKPKEVLLWCRDNSSDPETVRFRRLVK